MKRLIGMAAFILLTLIHPAMAGSPPAMTAFLQQQEKQLNAHIGMAVVNAQGESVFGYRQDERFPLTSTFKTLACAALLERLQKDGGSLDQQVTIQPDELLDYAPITKNYLAPATLSLRTLCAAAVSYSDNTAGNRILAYLGGPQAITQFMRRLGDNVTRLDRTEPTLNEAMPGDARDTSSPKSMAAGLQKILTSNTLTPANRATLDSWMREDKVGDALLRATLPQGWSIADKTGAGGHGSRAIIAAVYPPQQAPFYVAIYITRTEATMPMTNTAIAQIGERLFAQ
ncbi:class A beta-lactamase [Atlantibacter hermannii]|uniref:Beta-lactamase n=1 Tax=Atlantibacter hermannii TaxID=565 RepID=A0A2K8GRJ1_ATLHE|nr:class A beta-lactamase [Atlantibacter hermannii]ASH89414.1 penicillin-hydrolyzing class A beta-lactamase [Atlantibacter hermannii]MBL7637843.1 class A beta-lactamase [Atlantibacter hermannii]MBL7672933.1 class A beta-lactamase [Atlantibacter hermannii]